MTEQPWQNRIVGHGEESPEQLVANPKNWRIHPQRQQKVLEGAINDVGYLRSVTVNKRTGYVLDGHLRVSMAISSGQDTIPVEYVDLTEEEEAEALVTLDPIAAMAVADAEQLRTLLDDISTQDAAMTEWLQETKDTLTAPDDSDWAAAFDGDAPAGMLDVRKMTFYLPDADADLLADILRRYDGDRNIALMKMVRECLPS